MGTKESKAKQSSRRGPDTANFAGFKENNIGPLLQSSCDLSFGEIVSMFWTTVQAPVVQRVDKAIHQINHYPVDNVVCFANTYPLDGHLSSG